MVRVLLLVSATSLLFVAASAQNNPGILDGLRNLLRARRQPQGQFFSQPQRFRQPPNRFQPRPQSNRFNSQSTRFNRPQSFNAPQQQSFNAPQQQQSFRPNNGFNSRPQSSFGRPQSGFRAQQGRPSFGQQSFGQQSFGQQSSFGQQQSSFGQQQSSSPVNGCPASGSNHEWNGGKYILTFLLEPKGCKTFTGELADEYCRQQGGRAVSLDSDAKAEHFLGVSAEFAQRYYWTGGRLDHNKGLLTWPSGRSEGWVRGTRFWSTTGGSESKGPQPDNRSQLEDGGKEEVCLGVLNNFYADGIKWHDVACHHKKPTICEL